MKRLFAVFALAVFGFSGTAAQKLPDNHQKIIDAIESRDYAAAIAELQLLQASDEQAFASGNYDYLVGRAAEKDGRPGLAMSSYHSVVSRDSDLRAHALARMSGIARSTGNLALERIYLNEILVFSPKSALTGGVVYRLARNSFESGNYGETIRILNAGTGIANRASPGSGTTTLRRENQRLLGHAYLLGGQMERAREIFLSLLDSVPNPAQPDDVSLAAAMSLDLIGGGSDKTVPNLAEHEHLRRANIYQFNREFRSARLHFESLIANYPDGANTADAAFQIGRGYAQQTEFSAAVEWFERLLERYPQSVAAREALLNAASAYARSGKSREAITRYQQFIERYPQDEKLERAYLNIIDVYRDQGSESEALKWCAQTRDAFAGKLPAALALFAEARIYIAREDWQNALRALEQLKTLPNLGGTTVPGGTSKTEIDFLLAFALEQSKRYAEAIDAYLSIPDGRREYYGWRATLRLQSLSNDETARSFVAQKTGVLSAGLKDKDPETIRRNAQALVRLTDVPDVRERAFETLRAAIRGLPRYQGIPVLKPSEKESTRRSIGEQLMTLGLYDEAAPEMDAIGDAYTRAARYARGNRADLGLAFIEPIWRNVPADYPVGLIPREHFDLLYPAPFADELLRFAPDRSVDPRLVLAIMRQESRFQPDAKSYAAARGLMQFISTTATQVAGELGRDDFAQDDLYYPPTAVLFGSQYLAGLFKIFPNQSEAVAASYNGGDDNMKRWLARSRSNLPERYVPEIAYAQTKDYVYKVMANYRMYQFIYDEQLRRK